MKKFTLLFAFLAIISMAFAQTWHWINPTTGLQQINDISFISPDQGMAVGDNGAILHFDNGEWSIAESPVNTTLNDVEFIHPSLAWAVGDAGVILHYNGNNWLKVSSPITGYLKDIFYVDETHCWAVGSSILFYNGTSWQIQAEISGLETVGFLSPDEGWAGSLSTDFYYYSNGTWLADPTFADGNLLFFHSIEPAGEGRLLMNGKNVEGEGLLYENTGQGWQHIASGAVNAGISFYDASHGFGIEHARPLNYDLLPTIKHFSNDAWSTAYTFEKRYQLFTSVEAIAGDEAVAGDVLGYIHHGKDSNWGLANGFMCDSILDINFVAPNKGFIAAHNSGIWKYDAGEWSNIFDVPDYTFNEINFSSESNGYAAAFEIYTYLPPPLNVGVKVFRVMNGVYTEMETPNTMSFYSPITSISDLNGQLVLSSYNSVWTIENNFWSEETLPATDSISEIRFQESIPTESPSGTSQWEAGWLCAKRDDAGISGVIYYKYFLDNVWEQVYQTPTGWFNDLCIFNYNQVYAVGTNGLIAYFDGTNWTETEPLTDEDLLSVHVDDNGNGWAVGKNGTMLKCEQKQWSFYNSPTTHDLNVVSFYNHSLGFIGGNDGAMLCTSEKLPVGILNKPIAQSYEQLHIYPNPTQESFFIEIHQPASKIQVSVSDMTGRILYEQSFGLSGSEKETIRINPGLLSRGLYFVKVNNGEQVMTGKVMIN